MSRAVLRAALSALWLIAFNAVPSVPGSNTPTVSGTAHAGTTVKSSKSNTNDRKGTNKKPGTPSPGIPGGRGY